MASKTRDRIVETALRVFNERRFGTVTLAMLADELGMAKGNLWYHFKDKQALLTALNKTYLERLKLRRQIWPRDGSELDDYVLFLNTIASEIRDYRFMFRDQSDYGEHSDVLKGQLKDIYDTVMEQFAAFFRAMNTAEHMTCPDHKIEALVFNAVLGLRYHLELLDETGRDSSEGSGAVSHGFAQSLALIEPYLKPSALSYLQRGFSLETGTPVKQAS